MTSIANAYRSMYAPKAEPITEEVDVPVEPTEVPIVEETKLEEEKKEDSKEVKKVEAELEKIVKKIDEDVVPVEEAVKKNISVWSHDGNRWSHYSDYDNMDDAKDDRRYLKDQGDKKVKILKTDMDKSDWRKEDHRNDAIKQLDEDVVEEGTADRSEFNANVHMSKGVPGQRKPGKFYLMKGNEQIHPEGHESVDDAMKSWKNLPDKSGVKIVKESVDGKQIDIITEAALMEAFEINAVGDVTDKQLPIEPSAEPIASVVVPENPGIPSQLHLYGKRFTTIAFRNPDDVNKFLESDAGKDHGYLGKDDDEQYHCAHMEHTGDDV